MLQNQVCATGKLNVGGVYMIYDMNSAKIVVKNEAVDARKIYEKHVVVAHISIQPSKVLEKHSSDTDALMYVLEGKAKVTINDQTVLLSKDQIVEFPKNVMHEIENIGNDVLRILVFKYPEE